jgi:hypothetical protein
MSQRDRGVHRDESRMYVHNEGVTMELARAFRYKPGEG